MTTSLEVQQLLDRATAILPLSDEDLIYKGIAAGVAERMMALRKAASYLQERYDSLEALEQMIQTEGVKPDDHTCYTDLLEWRAIKHEISQLQHIFETL
ncbi:MAG: hypothetical protein GVY30_00890 [Chloroflexi bacterium]|jgi:hypothetical protein|nr:hypothetical protein [Chloroflexota bacterium]